MHIFFIADDSSYLLRNLNNNFIQMNPKVRIKCFFCSSPAFQIEVTVYKQTHSQIQVYHVVRHFSERDTQIPFTELKETLGVAHFGR